MWMVGTLFSFILRMLFTTCDWSAVKVEGNTVVALVRVNEAGKKRGSR